MRNSFYRLGPWLLDVFLPQTCLGCDVIVVPSASGFCADCLARLEVNPPLRLEGAPLFAPYRYCGPLTKAIVRLKYEERSEFAARLVGMAYPDQPPLEFVGATLIPVPIHPVRLVERGYNQAGLLAAALGKRWRLTVRHQWLHRQSFVKRQVGLGREARAQNAKGAFAVSTAKLEGQRVVLVDDVVTTGATIGSCRCALTEAGARVIGIVAVARADAATLDVEAAKTLEPVRAGTGTFGVGL